ncbi:MAG TPA: serine/threonine-protein kinase [Kofleriaceae bacterium]|nr:serine/threonine-protein kinase [Kofleriaceae bacterium]
MDACLGTETLVDLVEGRSDAVLRARIEEHASRCDSCRRVLSSLARGSEPAALPERDAAHEPPLQVGRYVIVRVLGAGGMGIVYAARDPELDRTVAVKLLRGSADPKTQERLRREARAMAQLAHPHVVAVFDVGVHGDRTFVAMEHVEGETLAEWLRTPRTERAIVDAFIAAGRGLAAAHAVGIVHRDFKPENVLVGQDGRVRVVDFGLARDAGQLVAAATAGESVSPYAPTTPARGGAESAIGGTPFYMAPELYRGGEADPRSDQFSFCVALYVALYGERPFEGETLDALANAVTAGRIRVPRRRASRRVAAAIERGLAVDPAARFPAIDELIAALLPRPRRWPWIAAPFAAVALATPLAFAAGSDEPRECTGAGAALQGVWEPSRKQAVASALAATGLPYIDATWREVERRLDRYAADWQTTYTAACEATRVRAEQSEDVLDLRMACLDERRHALDALVTTLAARDHATDRTVAEHAAAAAAALPALGPCSDIAALRSRVRPPNATVAAQVAALRAELATLRARRDAGLYAPTLAPARTLAVRAKALGYRPLEGEALALVATLEDDTDDFATARASYEQAILAAEAGRDDARTADSVIALIGVLGHGRTRPPELDALRGRARALLERLDHPPRLEAALLDTVGWVELQTGQLADADRDLRAALAAYEQLYGRDDLRVVRPLESLASLELERDAGDQARPLLERALAIQARVLGDQHPAYARTLAMLGGATYAVNDYAGAIATYERALAIYERSVGPDSLPVANVLTNLATAHQIRGEAARAVELHRRAVAIAERVLGPTHPVTLTYKTGFATTLTDAHRDAEAVTLVEAILAAQRARLGVHQDTAATLDLLAYIELAMHRYAAARDHALEARRMLEQLLGDAYNPSVELAALGEAQFGLGEYAAACDAFEAARRLGADQMDPGTAAWLDAQLGRALVVSGRAPGRGKQLVLDAYPKIAADPRLTEQVAGIEAWMKQHHLSTRH